MGKSDAELERRDRERTKKEEARKRRANTSPGTGTADWRNVNPELLQTAIAAVAWSGGALRLGYTRDGGAYAIGVYGDGNPFTEYKSPNDDMDEYLKGLIEDYGR